MKLAALLVVAAGAPLCATTWYVTVAGLGGLPEYDSRFAELARELDKTLQSAAADARVETLTGEAATREKLRSTLESIARQAQPQDELVLLLIGHGTFDGAEYKFNLKGPDLGAPELAAMLDGVAARQVVVNTTSASGGCVDALRRENRVVIAATRSGTEKNATVFAKYFVEAFRDPSADTDKNDALSALEAFRYADQKTAQFYETQKRLATEHAVLEDTGKGEAVRAPSAANGEGLLAGRLTLVRLGAAQAAARSPVKQRLLAKREELEGQIEKLKYEKAAMPLEEYRKKLQALLIELAKTQAELDR